MYSFQGASIEKSLLQCEFSAALVFFGICSSVISTMQRKPWDSLTQMCSAPHLQMPKVLDSDTYVWCAEPVHAVFSFFAF